MLPHRLVELALFAAFLLVVAVDYWRKKRVKRPADAEAPEPTPPQDA